MVWHPIVVKSSEHFEKAVEEAGEKPVIVYFWSADDREHRTREDVMYALKGNAFSSMDGRFGEVVQLEVPTDKFPTVLDIFDVAATPSFLAIKEGHVYFENIGLCKDTGLNESSLRLQVYEFYSQIVPQGGGLFGDRKPYVTRGLFGTPEPVVVSQVIDSSGSPGVMLPSGQVQWGRKRPVDKEEDRDISSKRSKGGSTTTSTTEESDEATDLARAVQISIEQSKAVEPAAGPLVTPTAVTFDPDAREEDEDEDLQRALYLSQQDFRTQEDAPSSTSKGKQRETVDAQD